MLVHLVYYKETGKHYSTGEYHSDKKFLFEVLREVAHRREHGILPGIRSGKWPGPILIRLEKETLTQLVMPGIKYLDPEPR